MKAALFALSGAIALGGCAADKLTLLENEEGAETGAVAILDPVTGKERTELNTRLTEAKLTSRPKARAVKELKPAYTELIGSLPPKAKPFTLTFATGESKISDDQRRILEEIRNELSIRQGAQIEVVGFTDSVGSDKRNDEISKERALSVVQELRAFGFPVDPEDAVGRGEDDAKAKLGDEVADETYRSVIVVVR